MMDARVLLETRPESSRAICKTASGALHLSLKSQFEQALSGAGGGVYAGAGAGDCSGGGGGVNPPSIEKCSESILLIGLHLRQ